MSKLSTKASDRIAGLLDAQSFVEIGGLVTARSTDFNLAQKETPADGVITGYGTIDSGTGRFTSNGTEGDVTVYLNSGGQVVGQTTITIANPDQITFAETTASMGEGDTSDPFSPGLKQCPGGLLHR